ncbi:MAG: Glycosyltransferase [Candidatus Nomurabacteria bacterium GW2011_GWA1_46_11]|uniref:Glycosyl transferase family 1 n=2 Tax=Parcubacteria group TaxID=1794811 RepID=A0A1G1YVS4_9BACT|nr:MAG: Glycosyltransferase [Parcubacteria group bacterium GW2011_GWA2_46_10]KKU22214.1 MAG: Glycosyltransferase [Candidatus Nomurabacteria bacterium GW2011_GWA1_46_11]OGY56491.1 MAG: hypothetical protein A2119_00155 [Candidatus Colwellbacteria bacterium GWA2_46_10]
MRIGIFTNNYKPIASGVTVSIDDFREGLKKLGHNTFVFAPNFPGYRDQDKDNFRYPSASITRKTKYPIPLPSKRAQDFFEEKHIELVHSQHPWGVGRYGLKLARRFGVPVIFTNHTMYPLYIDYLPKILPRKILMELVERSAIRYANKTDAVIAPTESIKEYLVGKGVKVPISVVSSGVDKEVLDKAPAANLRKRFSIPRDHTLLLNLSRVGPEKNLPTILEAYERVLKKFPKTSLVFAGGGAFLEALKEIASSMGLGKKVFFTDVVQVEERGGYFREGDIFVHSSLSETQGLVIVDSIMVGVPVVAIRANGVKDVIEDGVSGLLTENSAEALAAGVIKLMKDKKLRAKLAKGARERAKKYTIEVTSKKLEEVYKKVLKGVNSS